MECSDPRHSDERRALAAMDQMDDETLATMATMMEEVARKHPRLPRPNLKIVKNQLKE